MNRTVIDFLAEQGEGSVRTLEGLMESVLFQSQTIGIEPSQELAKQVCLEILGASSRG
jgi:chromosomal replication initiation ATPase DnaA